LRKNNALFNYSGDPTIFGNLKPHEATIEAVQKSIAAMAFNGYAPTTGYLDAREAVAEYYSCEAAPLTSQVQNCR